VESVGGGFVGLVSLREGWGGGVWGGVIGEGRRGGEGIWGGGL